MKSSYITFAILPFHTKNYLQTERLSRVLLKLQLLLMLPIAIQVVHFSTYNAQVRVDLSQLCNFTHNPFLCSAWAWLQNVVVLLLRTRIVFARTYPNIKVRFSFHNHRIGDHIIDHFEIVYKIFLFVVLLIFLKTKYCKH